MFGNLKEILSIVQDGLNSNSSLRQTLSEVQKVKFSFNEKPQTTPCSGVSLNAGASILSHYHCKWSELHTASEENAAAARRVDELVSEIHQHASNKLLNSTDLYHSLLALPKLTAAVEDCIQQLQQLEQRLPEVERQLQALEDLADRRRVHKDKMNHYHHLSLYKEKKLAALEEQRASLSAASVTRHMERERRHMEQLQARAEASERAFNKDIEMYKTTGILPKSAHKSERAEPSVSLEQVELGEADEDLNAFLDT